jgi:hyperosmotically inducible protein
MKPIKLSFSNLALAAVVGVLAAGSALAVQGSKPEPPSFKDYDSDGDGRVSRAEFIAQGGHQQAFREGDADGDTFLNKEEFIKASANNDRIRLGKFVDDALITAKVKALLLKDESVKGLDVNVEAHKGTVQLSGWVSNPAQIPQAEKIAYGVDGVKAVRNDLQVKR